MLSQASILRLLGFCLLFSLLSCNSGSSGGGSSTAPVVTGVVASSFSPTTGSIGTLVLIRGQGFSSDPFQNTIRFGGKNGVAATVEVATATTLLTRVPVGSKPGKIFVSSPAGEGLTADDFLLLPQVNSFNPASAPVGAFVELLGSGFAEIPTDNSVSLNGFAAPVLDGDASKIVVSIPVGATTGDFVVSTAGGSISQGPFIVLPSITGTNAVFGLPGTSVTISGFNFRSNLADNQVAFNGSPAAVTAADYFSITTAAPAGFTTGPITVTTPDGTAIGPDFILPQTPSILNFTPGTGVPGSVVTVTGQDFLPGVMTVKFNGVPSTTVSNSTTTSLDAVVPAGATTGPIEVAHPFASALSATNFTILLPPAVTGIDPVLGSPGTTVRITGTNFDPTPSGNVVTFGGGAVALISNVTATGIDAVVPATAVTGPVTVTTGAGAAPSAATFRVVYPRFFAAANQTENTISLYQADPGSGEFLPRGFAFTGAGTSPRSIAATPDGAFVFVSLQGSNSIAVYGVSPGGLLTLVQTVPHGVTPAGLAVHPSGSYLCVANPAANTATVYAIASNGILSSPNSFATGITPVGVIFHPNGQFVYLPCSFNGPNGNNVSVFSFSSSGVMAVVERKSTGTSPSDFQIHPNGNFGYAVSSIDCTVRSYTIAADGKLTLVNTVGTGPLGANPVSFSVEPTGKFGFVVNQAISQTISYSIDPNTGALAILGSLAATGGQAPSSVITDLGGRVYIANKNSNDISLFTVNPSTGLMTFQQTMRGRQGPNALLRIDAATPVTATPVYAYAANSANSGLGNSVSAFQISGAGALGPNGGPVAAGVAPTSLLADPYGEFVYAGNSNPASAAFISQYRIGTANPGTLLANGSIALNAAGVATGPCSSLAREPSGRFLFAGNTGVIAGDGSVSSFAIDRISGALAPTSGSPIQLNLNSSASPSIAVNASGQLLYALSTQVQKRVLTFTIDPETGNLTLLNNKAINTTAALASLVAVHPNGRFIYFVDLATGGHRVVVFSTLADGSPDLVVQNITVGTQPSAIAFHPSGAFLYVTNQNSDSVTAFSVSSSAGTLTRLDADAGTAGIQDTATGDAPLGVTVDPSGRYLYVTNSGNGTPDPNSISAYAIGSTGLPTLIGTLLLPTAAPAGIAVVAQYQ